MIVETTSGLVYEKRFSTGVSEDSCELSVRTSPSHSPCRLCGRYPPTLPASCSCTHTRLSWGRALRTSSSAVPPPAVGIVVRCQGLARLPVAISAYAARMPFCRASAYFALSAGGWFLAPLPPAMLMPSDSPAVRYTEVRLECAAIAWLTSGFMKYRSSSSWARICMTDWWAVRTGCTIGPLALSVGADDVAESVPMNAAVPAATAMSSPTTGPRRRNGVIGSAPSLCWNGGEAVIGTRSVGKRVDTPVRFTGYAQQ